MPVTNHDSDRKRKATSVIVLPTAASDNTNDFSIDEGDYGAIRGIYWDLGVTEDDMGTRVRQSVDIPDNDEARRVSELVLSHEICTPKPLKYTLPSSIGQLQTLRQLSIKLSSVNLSLPKEIGKLTNLETLDLSHTNIQTISPAIWKLPNLKNLDLSFTKLKRIPTSIFSLVSLERLNLASSLSGVKSIPDRIGNLKNLKELNLENTQLKQLTDGVFYLVNLEVLNLANIKIKSLSFLVGRLSNLKYLSLRGNGYLHSLPETLCDLEKLETLDLQRCQNLMIFPTQIGNLRNLETLNLNHARIEPLPDSIARLQKLRNLYLRGWRHKNIPETIGDLASLEKLDISHSCIEELPPFLRRLSNLKELDLSYTQLRSLPDEIMDLGLPSVTKLNLFVSKMLDYNSSKNEPMNIEDFEASCKSVWKLVQSSPSLVHIGSLLIGNVRTFAKDPRGIHAKKLYYDLVYKKALPLIKTNRNKWPLLLEGVDGDPDFVHQVLVDKRDLFVEHLASRRTPEA